METIEKPTLYYIKGVEGRQEECIKALEAKGAQNTFDIDSNCKLPRIFYIDGENIIDVVFSDSDIGRLIISYGTELRLPEKPKVLTWKDVKNTIGFYLLEDTLCNAGSKYKADFATKQIAKSTQAAAMISQVREQSKETYGEIVELNEDAWTLIYNNDKILIVSLRILGNYGGLLRFQTREQAELFIENNRELVEEYLKTF